MDALPRLVKATELAAAIAMKPAWVRRHAQEIPHYKLGHCLRFDPAAVRAWLKARSRGSGQASQFRPASLSRIAAGEE